MDGDECGYHNLLIQTTLSGFEWVNLTVHTTHSYMVELTIVKLDGKVAVCKIRSWCIRINGAWTQRSFVNYHEPSNISRTVIVNAADVEMTAGVI